MPDMNTLRTDLATAGADYAEKAQALAAAAVELKAIQLALGNANLGGSGGDESAFQLETLNIPPHQTFLPTSPARGGVIQTQTALASRLEEILRS